MSLSVVPGLQSSIARSSQAFDNTNPPAPIEPLVAQVRGLALDSVSIAASDPAALASNQGQIQAALLSLRALSPIRDPNVAAEAARLAQAKIESSVISNGNQTAALVASMLRG
jgi:hypothetical protein